VTPILTPSASITEATEIAEASSSAARISLTALVNIANVLGVSVDNLIYDSVVHARPQLEREIQQIVDSRDDYELSATPYLKNMKNSITQTCNAVLL